MSWEGALYIFMAILVCVELHAMREIINRLHDEVEKMNRTVREKVLERMEQEEWEDEGIEKVDNNVNDNISN